MPNYQLYQRKCIERCPEKYYNSILDNIELDDGRNQSCLPCHYTCKSCLGSLDSQCLNCYSDAQLIKTSKTETFCYPIHVMSEFLSEKWYYRMFTITYLLVIIFAAAAVISFCIKRKRNNLQDKYVTLSTSENTKDIKTEIYSDSE